MTKKSNGEGSISFEASRKKYRAAIVDPNGKRIVKRFSTKKDAQTWLINIQSDIVKNIYIPPSNITVGEWVSLYLETYKANKIRERSFDRYITTANHLIPIAKIPLQKITAHTIQKFYNNITDLAPSTKNKIHKLLKAAFTKAVAIDLLQKNVMLAVDAPQVPKVEIEVFTKEEIIKILQETMTNRYYSKYYPFILLAVTTGARLGELLGLKIKNVKHGYIYIDNSLQAVRGKLVDMPPKTPASQRKITISSNVENILRTHISSNKLLDMEGYVFHTSNNTPYSPRNMERTWKKLLEATGIKHKNFHVLRHTMATQLLAEGVSIAEVANRLGHSKISHTLNLYSHAIPNYDTTLPNIIAKMYSL